MKMTFILQDGSEKVVPFADGDNLLRVAEEHDIPMRHNCEGFGVCGSCHVIIEEGIENLSEISAKETAALDHARGVTANSRLACQITLHKNNDALKVRIP